MISSVLIITGSNFSRRILKTRSARSPPKFADTSVHCPERRNFVIFEMRSKSSVQSSWMRREEKDHHSNQKKSLLDQWTACQNKRKFKLNCCNLSFWSHSLLATTISNIVLLQKVLATPSRDHLVIDIDRSNNLKLEFILVLQVVNAFKTWQHRSRVFY